MLVSISTRIDICREWCRLWLENSNIPMTMRVRRGVDRLRDDAGKFKFQRVDWYSWRLRVDRAWMSFVMYLYVQSPTD